ncbi:MAG: glycosyl transferase [Proteobacteria bacterium]|nr:MAG: glycosyl transferase [Pseudomonadota bacterium]
MQLIYLSPVPWASFAQRPHKFVEWFHSRHGDKVLWIEPYPTRFPEFSDLLRKASGLGIGQQEVQQVHCPEWLTVIKPKALPIEPLPGSGIVGSLLWASVLDHATEFLDGRNSCLAIGKPSELALQLLQRHPNLFSVFDAMDDFAAFYRGLSSRAMQRTEAKIVSRVRRLLVSSTSLANRFSSNLPKPVLARNACAMETLPPVDKLARSEGAVLGYVGTIASWFDWSLVINIANENPASLVRLVGPVYTPPPMALPKNIELRPACAHTVAIQMMQEFSAGLIPFKNNALTSSVDPVKYYEYRALGLPVISTKFGEMSLRQHQDGVFLISERDNLKNLIEKTKFYQPEVGQIERFRLENNWHARFDAANILDCTNASF